MFKLLIIIITHQHSLSTYRITYRILIVIATQQIRETLKGLSVMLLQAMCSRANNL